MSSTIDDFRNFFKVDKVKRNFIVNEAIDSTLELLEGSFKHNNIAVDKEYQYEKIELLGHKNELEQVLLNIINNAKDALLQNHIKNAKIDIKLESTSQKILINIVDNAGGIPSDIIDKIFDPYFTTKEQGKGTGIGLYMSKMIIETNMNGKIEVQNINNGASFIIKIPKGSLGV
jgi:C4-dicarboxylate-specific signal transduction histidine kinase